MRTAVVGGVAAALVAATSVGVGAGAASAKPPKPAPCPGVLACGDDVTEALTLEQKIDDHFVSSQVIELDYGSAARTPGDVANVGAWGDSGLWTGTYLAAESYRYAIASRYLGKKKLADDQRAFWTAQRDQALPRIQAMVEKYHLLTNIAVGWKTTFAPDPTASPPTFGGGVIQGEPGMLMRACAPDPSPANVDIERNKRVFGPWPWTDGRNYICETAPSRDTYAGTTFGLLTAFDLLGADFPSLRDQIRDDILTLASFLVKYQWNYPRPHGQISAPPLGHDFDNFFSPLFVYVPMARLNMAQAARHVANVAGTAADKQKWAGVWQEELATQGPSLAPSMEVDAVQPNEGYFKFNLHHLTGYSLIRLEDDAATRGQFRQAFSVLDHTTGDDINAHFETLTYGLTGEPSRRDAAVEHLREWRDYRARIDLGGETDNKAKCGVTIECVAQDQLDVMVGSGADGSGADVPVPGTATVSDPNDVRARSPLPVADRPPTDFLWQRPPTQLNGGTSATHEAPGVDYLLPYWMLRYFTEVREPALAPFPPYAGPAHQ